MQSIRLFIFACLFILAQFATAQVTVSVRITSGSSGTSCTDGSFGGAPEPMYGVTISSGSPVYFPQQGICFVNPPLVVFSQSYNCAAPATLNVCFNPFEDDGTTCTVSRACNVSLCQNFAVPSTNSTVSYTLSIPNCCGNASWGSLNFEITRSGSFLPSTAGISTNSPVCAGSSLQLSATGVTNVTWSGPESYTSSLMDPDRDAITPTQAGVYSFTGTDTNGCATTQSATVVVNTCPEICNNGVDDDADGLIDLADPDCPCRQ